MKQIIQDSLLAIDNYQLVVRTDGKDTKEGKCRGLLIHCRNNLKAEEIMIKKFDKVTEMAGLSYHGDLLVCHLFLFIPLQLTQGAD